MIRAAVLGLGLVSGLALGGWVRPSSPAAGPIFHFPFPTSQDRSLLHHIGLAVTDIQRSIGFYRDLLGMELMGPVSQIDDDPVYNNIFALPKVKAKGAMLRLGQMHIELFEFQHPKGNAPDPRQPVNNPRIYHVAFEVEDVRKEYERLRAAGVYFHYPPQDFKGIAVAAYGRDPDGNVFEILQWTRQEPGRSR